jgi:fumarate reductase flavoprotein subunit
MSHLGPEAVRRQFKGMVERCADCGFDLAAGRVEVVPTAHYMMGGVVFAPDCSTPLPALFAAGEDTGGVHGANRLGGNGVANSTVFGGIAGDRMATWVRVEGAWRAPDDAAIARSIAAHTAPFGQPVSAGALEAVRDALARVMWDDVGILRDAAGLQRAIATLDELDRAHAACGVDGHDRAFHPGWHDWMNLRNLLQVSRTIAVSALAREDSRGAHYREDFPEPGPMAQSACIVVQRGADGSMALRREPVRFTRVRPGQSLVAD